LAEVLEDDVKYGDIVTCNNTGNIKYVYTNKDLYKNDIYLTDTEDEVYLSDDRIYGIGICLNDGHIVAFLKEDGDILTKVDL
jgi:hypothetical protein